MENTQQNARQQLISDIVERELVMFLNTPSEGGPASCQQRPDAFRIMRAMAHCVHHEATLLSYLNDLQQAEVTGRNFMLEKYARMGDQLPPLSESPHIARIAATEAAWMEEAARLYPRSLQSQGGDHFLRYISCELETLSDQTLDLYREEVEEALEAGRNLVVERHDFLCQKLGFASLADREAAIEG